MKTKSDEWWILNYVPFCYAYDVLYADTPFYVRCVAADAVAAAYSTSLAPFVSLPPRFVHSFVHFIQIALIVDDVSRAWNHLFLFWWNETFNWNRFPTKYSATDHFAGFHSISSTFLYVFGCRFFFNSWKNMFFYLHGFHLSIIRDVQFIHSFPFMQRTGESLFI